MPVVLETGSIITIQSSQMAPWTLENDFFSAKGLAWSNFVFGCNDTTYSPSFFSNGSQTWFGFGILLGDFNTLKLM